MRRLQAIGILVVLLLALSTAWAQSEGTQPAPPPAFGQEQPQPQAVQFPPLSGLDEAALEPNIAARSFIIPVLQASEVVDSNFSSGLNGGNSSWVGSTRLSGMLGVQRLWSRYQLRTEYTGSGALYTGSHRQNTQMHKFDLDGRILWRRGMLAIRDTVDYLPEGTFGSGTFGGVGGIGGPGGGVIGGGVGGGSGFNFFGSGFFGTLGSTPRLMNLSIVDVQESLTPRTSITLSGGYNLVHFMRNTGGLLLDSRQVTAQAGYNHALDRRNTLAAVYGYQDFQFPLPGAGSFQSHVVHLLYGHQVSGRMSLLLGAGPQLTNFNSPAVGQGLRVSVSARVSLRYRFPKTSMSLAYNRFDSSGSGFFAGATSDVVRFTASRPLGQKWDVLGDAGYSHHERLQNITAGVNASSFDAAYAGLRFGRVLTRTLHGFLFYHFNELDLGSGFCGTSVPCTHLSTRHVAGIGLSWQPKAIRID